MRISVPRGGMCVAQMPVSQMMYVNRSQYRVLAQASYREGLRLWQETQQVEQRLGIVSGPAGLAGMAAVQGQAERAATLVLQDAWLRRRPRSHTAVHTVEKGAQS